MRSWPGAEEDTKGFKRGDHASPAPCRWSGAGRVRQAHTMLGAWTLSSKQWESPRVALLDLHFQKMAELNSCEEQLITEEEVSPGLPWDSGHRWGQRSAVYLEEVTGKKCGTW